MRLSILLGSLILTTFGAVVLHAAEEAEESNSDKPLNIKRGLFSVNVVHEGKPVEIQRVQDRSNLIHPYYRTTGRGSITPMHPFGDKPVETIGELEMLDYLQQQAAPGSAALVIDARVGAGYRRGTIPGSTHISFRSFGDELKLAEHFQRSFGVNKTPSGWDFSQAKTLALFCNGAWCRQSITAINRLLRTGYPAEKLKYYRGGMQAWHSFGLTVVQPSP